VKLNPVSDRFCGNGIKCGKYKKELNTIKGLRVLPGTELKVCVSGFFILGKIGSGNVLRLI
jgi:hypothetical protein